MEEMTILKKIEYEIVKAIEKADKKNYIKLQERLEKVLKTLMGE